MKKLNKKGFTLIELLAVIIVLAVVMLLAVNAVIPQMNKARKNAFLTEAQTYFNGAEAWYSATLLEGRTPGGCVNFDTLEGEYVTAKDSDKLKGYVKIETVDGKNNYTIWMTNGEYSISGKSPAVVASNSTENPALDSEPVSLDSFTYAEGCNND